MTHETMSATIWHNPRCGTARATLALLRAHGIEPRVVLYLETPPDAATLAALYARAGLAPRDGLRRTEPGAAALADATDDTVLAAMAADPILIQRPLVETVKGVRLCRPAERVLEIL